MLLSAIEVILHAPGPSRAHCCLLHTRHLGSLCPLARLHLISDNHANIPTVSFLHAGCPFCRPTNSIKALKAYVPLIHYYIIRPHALDPLVGWEGCPSPYIIPLDAFSISIRGTLGALSLVPHFSDQSYAPGWTPGLPPAKSGPGSVLWTKSSLE